MQNVPEGKFRSVPALCKTIKDTCLCSDRCATNYGKKSPCQYKSGCLDRGASNYDGTASCHNQRMCTYTNGFTKEFGGRFKKFVTDTGMDKNATALANSVVFQLNGNTGISVSLDADLSKIKTNVEGSGYVLSVFEYPVLYRVISAVLQFLQVEIEKEGNIFADIPLQVTILGEADGHRVGKIPYNNKDIINLPFFEIKEANRPGGADDLPNLPLNNPSILNINGGDALTERYPMGAGNLALALLRAYFVQLYIQNLKPSNTNFTLLAIDNEAKDKEGTYRRVVLRMVLEDYLMYHPETTKSEPVEPSTYTECKCPE
jgi:hypothetical protein